MSGVEDSEVGAGLGADASGARGGGVGDMQPGEQATQDAELRRSQRDTKLSPKAKESKTVELSAQLFKEINLHSDTNDDFLETIADDSCFTVETDEFMNQLSANVLSVTSIYDKIKSINDDLVTEQVETMFSQFLKDIELVKEQIRHFEENKKLKAQHDEEQKRLSEEEKEEEEALVEAQRKLDEEFRLYQEKRERRQRRFKSSPLSIETTKSATTSNQGMANTTVTQPLRKMDEVQSPGSSVAIVDTHKNTQGINVDSEQSSTTSHAANNIDWMNSFTRNLVGSISKVRHRRSVEPAVFKGNAIEFADWEVDFDSYIEAEDLTQKEALRHLKKFVASEAKSSIDGYFLTNTEEAYVAARKTLKNRYGNRLNIARAFRKQLAEWPQIKSRDGVGIRAYGDLLAHIESAMEKTPGLKILDDCVENAKMAEKLPDAQRMAWARRIAKTEDEGEYPKFTEFANFVATEAKILLQPMIQYKSKEQDKPSTQKARRSFQSSTESSQKRQNLCNICDKDNHKAVNCHTLRKLSYKEKVELVMKKRLCFACLKTSHQSKDCRHKETCSLCGRKHPTLLHNPDWSSDTTDTRSSRVSSTESANQVAPTTTCDSAPKSETKALATSITRTTYSMMVPVYVSAKRGIEEKLVYALLDTQADASFITEDVAKSIGAPCHKENVKISTMNGDQTKVANKYEGLKIRGYLTGNETALEAYGQNNIKCDRQQIPTNDRGKHFPHLQEISTELSPMLDIPIGLLIGADCPEALTPISAIPGNPGQTFAIETMFGWTLCGGKASSKRKSIFKTDTELFKLVEQDFNAAEEGSMSQEDMKFIQTLRDGIRQEKNGTYVMPLPFREQPKMPDNRVQAEKRFMQLQKKLLQDKEYKQEYVSFMSDLINNGHAEEVEPKDDKEDGEVWYLPHFSVRHPKKKKLRVVFDASATYNNTSLNDWLLPGPAHINDLLGILCRFRKGSIAVTCDIEKMFYNFKVEPKHRDFLRFLWFDENQKDIKTYRMTVHLFGATSSPGVATFGLRKLAKDHSDFSPAAADFLLNNFYVDDGITSVDSLKGAKQLIMDARGMCTKANIRLHKFVSNKPEVLEELPSTEIAVQPDMFKDAIPAQRTLGVDWCVKTDMFKFTSNLQPKPMTRRGVLSTVAQVYDPIGLVSPFTLKGKNILQETCRRKLEWDDELDRDIQHNWTQWMEELKDISKLAVNRCIKPDGFGEVSKAELHHFSDASEKGYGACSYLRVINSQNEVYCSLVLSKSRVAPLKKVTIPRMELQGALVAALLSHKLQQELDLKIDAEHFWCDSEVVLGYINNESRRFHTYIANRVQRIRDLTEPEQWHHIPGKLNPADLASRGASVEELITSRWFLGPQFLWKQTIDTSLLKSGQHSVDPEDPEVYRTAKSLKVSTFETLDLQRFSDWDKLVKACTIVRLIGKQRRWKKHEYSVDDLQETEAILVRMDQRKYFSKEINCISEKKDVNKDSGILRLTPYLDEDRVLRVGSRAVKSSVLTPVEKHPAIIHKDSHLAQLLISKYHNKIHHQGRTFLQAAMRQAGYWVIGAQGLIKRYIHKCAVCQVLRGRHMVQLMGKLPKERVEPAAPFTHVGVDTFGHFVVKERRTELKRWCIIFTCMYSRATHIEVVDDLSTDAFLQALRRLQSIRGPVHTIFSDAGTNFMGAKNLLDKQLARMPPSSLKELLQRQQITFKTNTPGASHQGGVWEREIRTVRAIFNEISLKYSGRMNTEALRTSMYEVMYLMNSKPLTADCLNSPDEIIITPNHLLTAKSSQSSLPPGSFDSQEIYGKEMYRKTQQLAEEFWKHFQDYLMKIETRQKWTATHKNLKVGDIVSVIDENTPRCQWKLGIVEHVKPDSDGLVRKVSVRVADTNRDTDGKRTSPSVVYDRPIQKLILIVSK